jgi:hypothetical protein
VSLLHRDRSSSPPISPPENFLQGKSPLPRHLAKPFQRSPKEAAKLTPRKWCYQSMLCRHEYAHGFTDCERYPRYEADIVLVTPVRYELCPDCEARGFTRQHFPISKTPSVIPLEFDFLPRRTGEPVSYSKHPDRALERDWERDSGKGVGYESYEQRRERKSRMWRQNSDGESSLRGERERYRSPTPSPSSPSPSPSASILSLPSSPPLPPNTPPPPPSSDIHISALEDELRGMHVTPAIEPRVPKSSRSSTRAQIGSSSSRTSSSKPARRENNGEERREREIRKGKEKERLPIQLVRRVTNSVLEKIDEFNGYA